jgi:hypothetical protein
MAKFVWAIMCDRAILSSRNTVTLVDLLEEVQMPRPPNELIAKGKPQLVIPMRFAVVSLWERSDAKDTERASARMRFLAPNNKVIGETPIQIDLKTFPRFRALAEAQALPYFGPGEYAFRFELRVGERWRAVGSTQFTLRLIEPSRTQ